VEAIRERLEHHVPRAPPGPFGLDGNLAPQGELAQSSGVLALAVDRLGHRLASGGQRSTLGRVVLGRVVRELLASAASSARTVIRVNAPRSWRRR
jgi:hypothetical protein